MDMTRVSLSQRKPVGGGSERTLRLNSSVVLKIAPPRGSALELDKYKQLTRYQEYLSNDYCIACTYFQVTKGHFGTCPDLPMRKAYDGTTKGSGCAVWRLRTIYLRHGIEQRLPEKPTIRYVSLRVVRRRDQQYRRAKVHRYWAEGIRAPWFWHRGLPKFVYDYLLDPEPLPETIDLREPYGHYSDKLVWKDGKYRSKKPIPLPRVLTCHQCGKSFEQQPNTKGFYCSQSCFHQHRWKQK